MVIVSQVKLVLEHEKEAEFDRQLETFKGCTNWWIDRIREIESTNIKILHQNFYFRSKELFDVHSAQTCLCMNKAIQIARSSKKRRIETPRLNNGQLYFKTVRIIGKEVVLSFGNGAFLVPYHGIITEGKVKGSVARKKGKEWYLDLAVEIVGPEEKRYKRFMGVDLGIAKTATVADWNGKNTRFFGGEQFRFKKGHYRDLRKSMQSNLQKGNTYKALKHISTKETDWVTDMNHKISREIVKMAVENKRSIAIENLTGITERLNVNKKTRKMLKGWSFRQLTDFIKYKSKMLGITVVEVDPRGTSKTCPKCDNMSRSNRKIQERFICTKCGYESNADRVAAMNIALRGTELLA